MNTKIVDIHNKKFIELTNVKTNRPMLFSAEAILDIIPEDQGSTLLIKQLSTLQRPHEFKVLESALDIEYLKTEAIHG